MQVPFPQVVHEIREFFLDSQHWVYQSPGTPSNISPTSVYHIKQVQVLFEDRFFHDRTYRAIQELREEGFLQSRDVSSDAINTTLLWNASIRYVERAIKAHVDLMLEYSSPTMNRATGVYTETLVLMGLSRLHLELLGSHTNSYNGKVWTDSGHDLDYIMERSGVGFGIEVKNTFDYIPDGELVTKLEMCKHLGLVPLFIVRNRYSNQWVLTKTYGGLLYIFKSKMFPPGHNALVEKMWQEMRLPVAIWTDWPGQFYTTIESFIISRQ